MVKAPVPFMVPANTSAPGIFSAGIDSPVIVDWSTSLAPETTVPSPAIRSPGRTMMMSPMTRSAASTVVSLPRSSTRHACAGAKSNSPRTESAVRRVKTASSAPEVAKMTMSRAPSKIWPIAAAPMAATIMSKSTSRVRSRSARSPSMAGSHPPAR